MEISEFNKNHKSLSKKEVIDFVLEHQQEDLPTNILGIVFERVYINPSTGQTDGEVCVTTLRRLHHSFEITNGNSWGRRDRGYLGNKYNIVNHRDGKRIVSVSTNGFKTAPIVPTTKKIEVNSLEKLRDTSNEYRRVTASLIMAGPTSITSKAELEEQKDHLVTEMLDIINQMTNTL